MFDCGSVPILEALPIPLGSTTTLFIPPIFAGPGAIPLIGTFPVPAEPAIRANCAYEAAGVARIAKTAKAVFIEMFDMAKLHCGSDEADVGRPSAGTIKMIFRQNDFQICARSKRPFRESMLGPRPDVLQIAHQKRNRRTEPIRDASFGWRAAFLPLRHTVLFYSLHPDRELV